MITEKLEELIKQGATIWRKGSIWRNGFIDKIFPLKLAERNSHISMPDMRLWVGSDCFDINDLYETKDKAEWALKTVAERTERFEPPMWEDIDNVYQFKFFCNNKYYYCFTVNKQLNFIDIDTLFSSLTKLSATKENYEKACEIVRDLFNKGDKND